MRWSNGWLIIAVLTVHANYIDGASTIENGTTIKPTTTLNISCTLTNVTNEADILKAKSSCDNEIIYLFVQQSQLVVFPHVFDYFPSLQSVDVSTAGIQHIESTTFEKATHLVTLDMDGSNMPTLANSLFERANNLTSFDLSNSSVETIEKFAFHGLSNLKRLDLSYNKIRGLSAEMFYPLSRLETIRLMNNRIEVISNDLFTHNVQLQWAYLSGNAIVVVDPNAFMNCQVKELDLGLNQLHDLDVATMKYLRTLTVTGNRLDTLTVSSSIGNIHAENNSISAIHSDGNSELSRLYLSSNHLANLQNLSNFGKLKYLDLSYNHLRNFSFSDLKALAQLMELKITGNKLPEIQVADVVTNLPNLKLIELTTKHWTDAYVKRLEDDLKSHSIILGQDRSILPDEDAPFIPTPRPTSVTQKPPINPATPTQSPNDGNVERRLNEISKRMSDLEYKTGANAAADSRKIDGRLLDVEDKLAKSIDDNNAKLEAIRSSFAVYEALVIIMFVTGSVFILYKVIVYSKSLLNGMRYRRTLSRDPIFSEQDL